nr:unnamed protein product [Digitaria exilis]
MPEDNNSHNILRYRRSRECDATVLRSKEKIDKFVDFFQGCPEADVSHDAGR